MALTRKLLKGMGLTDEQVDTIIEAHTDTVDGLKSDISKYKADAEKLPNVQKELDELKAKGNDGWKEKHDAIKKEFEGFKQAQTDKEAKAAKEKAARAYFEGKNIEGANLNIAMRSSAAEIAALELDGDKIKDTASLDALVGGDLAGLVTKGTHVRINMGGKLTNTKSSVTKEDIVAMKDGAARRKAMMENPELFGLAPEN